MNPISALRFIATSYALLTAPTAGIQTSENSNKRPNTPSQIPPSSENNQGLFSRQPVATPVTMPIPNQGIRPQSSPAAIRALQNVEGMLHAALDQSSCPDGFTCPQIEALTEGQDKAKTFIQKNIESRTTHLTPSERTQLEKLVHKLFALDVNNDSSETNTQETESGIKRLLIHDNKQGQDLVDDVKALSRKIATDLFGHLPVEQRGEGIVRFATEFFNVVTSLNKVYVTQSYEQQTQGPNKGSHVVTIKPDENVEITPANLNIQAQRYAHRMQEKIVTAISTEDVITFLETLFTKTYEQLSRTFSPVTFKDIQDDIIHSNQVTFIPSKTNANAPETKHQQKAPDLSKLSFEERGTLLMGVKEHVFKQAQEQYKSIEPFGKRLPLMEAYAIKEMNEQLKALGFNNLAAWFIKLDNGQRTMVVGEKKLAPIVA